jgi:transcription factor 1
LPICTADSSLIFFAHLPSTVHGEQLMAQFVAAIANRLWLYRFSRMPMFFVCSEHVAKVSMTCRLSRWRRALTLPPLSLLALQRCVAGPGDKLRGKMTALAQALGEPRILLSADQFLPHEDHFWPSRPTVGPRLPLTKGGISMGKLSSGLSKADNCLLLIEPRVLPMVTGIDMEAYDFILRNLFVLRKTAVGKALTHMAPGANSILSKMKAGHPAMKSIGAVEIDPETSVEDLSVSQLVGLAKMFERWPFRPQHLFEVSMWLPRFSCLNISCLTDWADLFVLF